MAPTYRPSGPPRRRGARDHSSSRAAQRWGRPATKARSDLTRRQTGDALARIRKRSCAPRTSTASRPAHRGHSVLRTQAAQGRRQPSHAVCGELPWLKLPFTRAASIPEADGRCHSGKGSSGPSHGERRVQEACAHSALQHPPPQAKAKEKEGPSPVRQTGQ